MKLKDITELIVDSEHKTAPIEDEGYPYIRTPNIGRGRLILDDVRRISKESYKKWTRRAIPKENDLILAREAPVGNIAIVTDGLKPCLGQRTVLIRPDAEKVYPNYLVYLLLGNEIQERFHAVSTGSTVPHLNMSDIRGLDLPELPSYETQQKIASILSAFDDLIENNTRRIAILEEMARLIYREWFVHYRYPGYKNDRLVDSGTELGEVPEGWGVAKLSDILLFKKNTVKKSERENYDYYLPINHIESNSLLISTYDKIENANSSLINFNKGDILFGAMRPYFHKVTVAPFRGLTRSTCFVFEPVSAEFLSYSLLTIYQKRIVDITNKKSKGSTIPYAVWDGVMSEIEIIMPPLELITGYNNLVKPMIETIQKTFYHNRILKETRDLLLPKLISGKVGV